MITEQYPWLHPLDAAEAFCGEQRYWALLYSGLQAGENSRYSYLALHAEEIIRANDFAPLSEKLSHDQPRLENAWFGYLSYELLHDSETIAEQPNHYISLPRLQFIRFGLILRFDHQQQCVTCTRETHIPAPAWPPALTGNTQAPTVKSLISGMSKPDYLHKVENTKQAIARGEFYQANITRKITGEFVQAADNFALFRRLCAASPAAYSAFLHLDDTDILSSSPECFMTADAQGHITCRPIKGTAPRFSDAALDEASRQQLAASEKERAENLMIVDLMRNDLARSCIPGSVNVERLFEVSTYSTLHHMASTITGLKRPDISTLNAVRRAFPPGSMTGAPKIRAIEWCMEQEPIRRGVYSGALGWFGGDGSCDLSVVIRTLIIQGNRFEFQVGGAITADSDPEKEWQETITKARGILAALGVGIEVLEGI